MNVERLRTIAGAVLSDLRQSGVRTTLNQLNNDLTNLASSPQNVDYQRSVSDGRNSLEEALTESKMSGFPPIWLEALAELGLDDLLPEIIREEVDDVFDRNQMTPAAAQEAIQDINKRFQKSEAMLAALVDSMDDLGIREERAEPGVPELIFSIPRPAVHEEARKLGEEIAYIPRLFRPFEELATGSATELKVSSISSSSYTIYIPMLPATALAVAHSLKWLLDRYEQILRIRDLHKGLREEDVPKSALRGVEDHSNSVMEKGIKTLTEQLLKQYAADMEDGRKRELKVLITDSLNGLASRIDIGYSIEVIAEPLPGSDSEASDEDREAVSKIREISPDLKYRKLEGEPVLSLPLGSEDPRTVKADAVAPVRKRRKKLPSDPEAENNEG